MQSLLQQYAKKYCTNLSIPSPKKIHRQVLDDYFDYQVRVICRYQGLFSFNLICISLVLNTDCFRRLTCLPHRQIFIFICRSYGFLVLSSRALFLSLFPPFLCGEAHLECTFYLGQSKLGYFVHDELFTKTEMCSDGLRKRIY